MEDDNQPMMEEDMMGAMDAKSDQKKNDSKKSGSDYVSSEESWERDKVWVPRISKDDETWIPGYDFFLNCFMRFDSSFVIILILENISFGLWILVTLSAQDLFKAYMNQEPGDMAVYTALISLPWSLKLFYGLITDNVKIFGLRRKPYLIFFGFLQFVVMAVLFFYDHDSALEVTLYLMVASLSMAFSNVVVDAILVIQARKDPFLGSQDLLSIAWLFQGIAGVLGCVIAGYTMERYHPRYAFLGYGIYTLILGIACFWLSSDAERIYLEGEEQYVSEYSSELLSGQTPSEAVEARRVKEEARPVPGEEGFWYNFKTNMRFIWITLQRSEVYCIVIYFILDGFTNPSFADFSYFFLLNVIGVSKFMFAMITLIGQVCSVVGVIIYGAFLRKVEVRWVLFWNVVINVIGSFLNYCFAMRWNLDCGISDMAFIIFSDVVFGALSTAFQLLPLLSLFAKICPKRIEGTMFAFLTGTWNLDQSVISPMMGSWINYQFVGVTKDDQSGYSTLCLISFICSFIGFALLPLIPLRKDIRKSNRQRKEEEAVLKKESDERKAKRLADRNTNKDKKGDEAPLMEDEG